MALRIIGGLQAARRSLAFPPFPSSFTSSFTSTWNGVFAATFHATSYRGRTERREQLLREREHEKILRKLSSLDIPLDSAEAQTRIEAHFKRFDEIRKRVADRTKEIEERNARKRKEHKLRKRLKREGKLAGWGEASDEENRAEDSEPW